MSRIPKPGTAIAALYEYELTLDAALSSAGVTLASTSEKNEIREKLEMVLGLALQDVARSPKLQPDAGLQVHDLITALKSTARHLNDATQSLRGRMTGIRSDHEVHLAGKVLEFL